MAKNSGGGFGKVLLGFVLGLVTVVASAALYLKVGKPPVAVADKAFDQKAEAARISAA